MGIGSKFQKLRRGTHQVLDKIGEVDPYVKAYRKAQTSIEKSFDKEVNEEPTAADLSAADAAQEQYDYYKETFTPVERELKGTDRTAGEIEALSKNAGIKAGEYAGKAVDQFRRNAGRQGLGLSQDQTREANQMLWNEGVGGIAGAQTRTRSGLYDQNLENQGNIVALGRNLASSSMDAMETASANLTQVQNANRQIAAQNKQAAIGAGVTIAAAAIYVY